MRKKWTFWERIHFSGIIWFAIGIAGGIYLKTQLYSNYSRKTFSINSVADISDVLLCAGLFWFVVVLINIAHLSRNEPPSMFSWLDKRDESNGNGLRKKMAAYPTLSNEYLSKKPQGLVLGRYRNSYVYVPIRSDGVGAFFIGSPGAGKSTLLLGFLYSALYSNKIHMRTNEKNSDAFNFFMVDIKGELYESLLKIRAGIYRAVDNYTIQVVQPSNRESFGWDVFYRMRKPGVTTTDKLKAVTDIAEGLVEETCDNPYFSNNARKILTGVLFFYEAKGLDFVTIIQKLTRTNLGELLREIVDEAELDGNGIVLDKLKSFVGKEDNESIQDIEATLKTSLDCFSYPDIIYCLRDNPYKTSPAALNDGTTNIDLAIEESMLLTYKPIFRLICLQVLRHVEADFKPEDSRRTLLLFDEAFRIGKVEGLDGLLATARSRHCSVGLFFQDMSQFNDIYKKEKAESILNICELKCFLSGAGDKHTTDYISNMAGKYTDIKMSYGRNSFGKKDVKYSEEERNIVDGKSLMELREKTEIICIIYGHYYRFKKLQYFQDRYLKKIAEDIKSYNSKQKA